MINWNRDQQTFCAYVRWRWRRRRAMADDLRRRAGNEYSRKLADKLADRWGIDRCWPHPAPAQALAELRKWVGGRGPPSTAD